MTEKKERIKLGSQCRLFDPTREQSTAKPGGTSLTKMIVLLKPYWRINCKVVPFTVQKCNILNYSKNCNTKNVWLNYHSMLSIYSFRLPKKLSRHNTKTKYMIICESTSWVDRTRWRWKYGRHCTIIDILLSFSIPAPLLFSLCSPFAQFSVHLIMNAWNRSVLTMKILHWVIEGDKRSLQILLGYRYSINCIAKFFLNLSTFLECSSCTD